MLIVLAQYRSARENSEKPARRPKMRRVMVRGMMRIRDEDHDVDGIVIKVYGGRDNRIINHSERLSFRADLNGRRERDPVRVQVERERERGRRQGSVEASTR